MRIPVNVHRWATIAFLHWRLDAAHVAALLPDGLAPLTYDGAAWVGVTPFHIHVRLPAMPATPPGWAFPETNLRTYVTGPDGRQGLWFLRMEVRALWFATALRAVGLPYVWQRMSVDADGDHLRYSSRPRHRSREGGHEVAGRVGAPLEPPEGGAFERFTTARWEAYHRRGRRLLRTPVEHPPWRLRKLHLDTCMVEGLFSAAGLPAPDETPVAHFSGGVKVKIGRPRRVG